MEQEEWEVRSEDQQLKSSVSYSFQFLKVLVLIASQADVTTVESLATLPGTVELQSKEVEMDHHLEDQDLDPGRTSIRNRGLVEEAEVVEGPSVDLLVVEVAATTGVPNVVGKEAVAEAGANTMILGELDKTATPLIGDDLVLEREATN